MATEKIQRFQAREYVLGAISERVHAISAVAIARKVECDERKAQQFLLEFEREGLVKVRGYVMCPECEECVGIVGDTLESLAAEANRTCGQSCKHCKSQFPNKEDIQLRLSFFSDTSADELKELTRSESSGAVAEMSSPIRLDELRNFSNFSVTGGDGAQFILGSTVEQHAGGSIAKNSSSQAKVLKTPPAARSKLNASGRTASPGTDISTKQKSPWWMWPTIAAGCGAMGGVAAFKLIPDTYPRLNLAALAAVAMFLTVLVLNPAYWYRKMAMSLAWTYVVARGIGIVALRSENSPIGNLRFKVDGSIPPIFDAVVLVIVLALLWRDREVQG